VSAEIEKTFKQMVKGRLHRGKVEVTFNLFEYDPENWDIQLNEPLLEAIINKFTAFQGRHPGLQLTLDSFLKIPMIFHLESMNDSIPEAVMDQLKTSMEEVLERFLSSRCQEGKLTGEEIRRSLDAVAEHLEQVEKQASEVEASLVQHYRDRIVALIGEGEIDERRIAQEAAIAADRSCIAEELSRLSAHRQRMAQLCVENSEFIGREADFLAQEMMRETHTIASKTNSLDVHHSVLQIRRQIEKIKQQVQNVE